MSLSTLARLSAIVAVGVVSTGFALADLKGDYKVEFVVEETAYTGTAKAVAGSNGTFTAKFEFTAPAAVTMDATGKTTGDSVTYEAKYEDKGRGCTGTLTGQGTMEKDGSKASGAVQISDNCSGVAAGTFRIWR